MQNENITAYLSLISIPVLAGEQWQKCEGPILESELLKALKNMSNNKSPRNDGLTKEFYETFWKDLKKPLCASITKALRWVKSFSETSSYKTYRKRKIKIKIN